MIAHVKGTLTTKSPTEAVVDCNGTGYGLLISLNTSEQLPAEGQETLLYTLLIPREDALNLYGFWTKSEREAFKILISITGVGPKVAMGILSSLTVDELRQIILQGNLPALQKLPGIGKKTAERLNLELKDKILKLGEVEPGTVGFVQNFVRQEALSALIALGYSRLVAEKAVRKALDDTGSHDLTAEVLIKQSLKYALM